MQIVDHAGLPPAVCFLCEASPTENQTVVDTQRDFEPGGPTYLNGRKYVCSSCVEETARMFGFTKGSDIDKLKVENDFLTARVHELEDRARQVAEQILGNAEIAVSVREAKKPTAKKTTKTDAAES